MKERLARLRMAFQLWVFQMEWKYEIARETFRKVYAEKRAERLKKNKK
jgi:hypothetical protein